MRYNVRIGLFLLFSMICTQLNAQDKRSEKIHHLLSNIQECAVNTWSVHTFINDKFEDSVIIINAKCNDTVYYEVKKHIKVMLWPGYRMVAYPSAKMVSLSPGVKNIGAINSMDFKELADNFYTDSINIYHNRSINAKDSSVTISIRSSTFYYSMKFDKNIKNLIWIEQAEITKFSNQKYDVVRDLKVKKIKMYLRSHKTEIEETNKYLNPAVWVNTKTKRLKKIWRQKGYEVINMMN